jgi:hypothetical protein
MTMGFNAHPNRDLNQAKPLPTCSPQLRRRWIRVHLCLLASPEHTPWPIEGWFPTLVLELYT